MMVVLPTTVENPRYNYKAYSSAFTDAWETDANIKYLRYASSINESRSFK
jgi:hypothetical protein